MERIGRVDGMGGWYLPGISDCRWGRQERWMMFGWYVPGMSHSMWGGDWKSDGVRRWCGPGMSHSKMGGNRRVDYMLR